MIHSPTEESQLEVRAGDVLLERYQLSRRLPRPDSIQLWLAWDAMETRHVGIWLPARPYTGAATRMAWFFDAARRMEGHPHPNLLPVLAVHTEGEGPHFFVTAFPEGITFQDMVERHYPRVSQVLRVLHEAARALRMAHGMNLVHGHVAPWNILIDPAGKIRLMAFQLYRFEDRTPGSPDEPYQDPDPASSPTRPDPLDDIYGLGMTALFGLFGRPLPPEALSHPRALVNALPHSDQLKRLLLSAIDPDRHSRYQSMYSLDLQLGAIPDLPESSEPSRELEQFAQKAARRELSWQKGRENWEIGAGEPSEDALAAMESKLNRLMRPELEGFAEPNTEPAFSDKAEHVSSEAATGGERPGEAESGATGILPEPSGGRTRAAGDLERTGVEKALLSTPKPVQGRMSRDRSRLEPRPVGGVRLLPETRVRAVGGGLVVLGLLLSLTVEAQLTDPPTVLPDPAVAIRPELMILPVLTPPVFPSNADAPLAWRPRRKALEQFALATTPITVKQYERVMDERAQTLEAEARNGESSNIITDNTLRYCNRLSKLEGLESCYRFDWANHPWWQKPGCTGYRLPTSEELEYAFDAVRAQSGGAAYKPTGAVKNPDGGVRSEGPAQNAWGISHLGGTVDELVWDYDGSWPQEADLPHNTAAINSELSAQSVAVTHELMKFYQGSLKPSRTTGLTFRVARWVAPAAITPDPATSRPSEDAASAPAPGAPDNSPDMAAPAAH